MTRTRRGQTGQEDLTGHLFPPDQGLPGRNTTTRLPATEDVARITRFLCDYPGWSAFWDKRQRVWRVAEDDPDSDLYAASNDANAVISYIAAHA